MKPFKTLRYHKKAIRSVEFHDKYPLFCSGSDDGSIIVSHGRVYNDLSTEPLIVPVKARVLISFKWSRILTEHIISNYSLSFKIFFESLCFITIVDRSKDIRPHVKGIERNSNNGQLWCARCDMAPESTVVLWRWC